MSRIRSSARRRCSSTLEQTTSTSMTRAAALSPASRQALRPTRNGLTRRRRPSRYATGRRRGRSRRGSRVAGPNRSSVDAGPPLDRWRSRWCQSGCTRRPVGWPGFGQRWSCRSRRGHRCRSAQDCGGGSPWMTRAHTTGSAIGGLSQPWCSWRLNSLRSCQPRGGPSRPATRWRQGVSLQSASTHAGTSPPSRAP